MGQARPTEGLERGGNDHLLVQQYCLRVVAGPSQGLVYKTKKESVTIGTHESTDLVLSDRTMSRFHCEIAIAGEKPTVRDLGSRNGTLIDGVSVEIGHLKDHSVLTLGKTQIQFELQEKQTKVLLSSHNRFGLLVGRSQPMRAVFAKLEQAVSSDVTVLFEGETGTGKDLAAESLCLQGARKNGPFVVVDCGAVPSNLLESQLFGHERGAFTGAESARQGAFESAHGGTLFLDEIGELGSDLQPKFLRILEAREVQRIGGQRRIPVDVRVVAATNRNLRREVNARRFRPDLYYRLAVLNIVLPPLRDRLEDLPLLLDEILANLGALEHPSAAAMRTPAFLAELERQPWPGNVRELRNYLERCLTVCDLSLPELPPADSQMALNVDLEQPLRIAKEQFERSYVHELLRRHNHKVAEAAGAAGISRAQLYRLMARGRL